VPDERIIWRSKGQKGHVDGAVTFHELAPNLTRILLVLEYHPQGMFERTGNLWRAQGRRTRLELKHFRRHMMTEGILHADELEGWRGTIHDGEVAESHEDAMDREEKERPAGTRQSKDGRAADQAEGDEEAEEAAGERAERGHRGKDTASSRAASGEDTGRSRAASDEENGDGSATSDEDHGDGRAASEEGSGNRRAASARSSARTPSRTRRASRPRSSAGEGENRDNGRRRRESARSAARS
jgi:hypothetical protein